MNLKRILSLLLAFLLTCGGALAAADDRNFLRGDEPFQSLSGFPDGGCVAGGALYMHTPSHLYVWRPGDGQPAPAAYELPSEAGEYAQIARLFADGDCLRALCAVSDADSGALLRLEIAEVTLDGDRVAFGEPVELDDVDALSVYYGSEPQLAQICGTAVAGGYLFLDFYDDTGARMLCSIDLTDGATNLLDVQNLAWIAPYDGERLLAETWDRDGQSASINLYDPDADEWTPACEGVPAEEPLCGLAYSLESGRLFFLRDGYVMAAEGFDIASAQPVAGLVARYPQESACGLLPGDRYAYISAYESICVRATDAGALPRTQIVVQGGGLFSSMLDGYYKFNASHDDAAVVMREDFTDDEAVLAQILSRDSSVDVRVMMTSGKLYDALCARGYLASLDSAALNEAVSGMYPAIRDALTRDGQLVAVPVYASGWTLGLDYEGFEKLGVPRAEIPDNWADFLRLLAALPERLPDDGSVRIFDEYATQRQVRTDLLREILTSWELRPRAEGEPLSYDSPELCAALEALMALDLDALGLPEGDDADGYMAVYSGAVAVGERDYVLVNTSADCTLMGSGNSEPALLSVIPGEEARLPLDLAVLCVNPASEHIDLAQEYLEAVCESLDEYDLYALSDRYSEPVPSPRYEQAREDTLAGIAAAREKLADPELTDRDLWEETLSALELQLETVEANRWAISPERIAQYRACGDRLAVQRYSYVDIDGSEETSDLARQFLDGRLDAANFLREIDRKVAMQAREAG